MNNARRLIEETLHPSFGLRADAVRAKAWVDLYGASTQAARELLGLEVVDVGGALAFVSAKDPNLLLNRVIGVGTHEPVTADALARAIDVYESRGLSRYLIHVPSEQALTAQPILERRGLERYRRSWTVLACGTPVAFDASTSFNVRPLERSDGARLGRIFADGFGTSNAAGQLYGSVIGRPGWCVYGAFDDDELVGGGVRFVSDQMMYLTGAVVIPSARKRGIQSALIARSLRDASRLGVTVVFSETGEPVAGEPNPSMNNLERAGLSEVGSIANFVPRGTRWA